jgi:hypothetical protein
MSESWRSPQSPHVERPVVDNYADRWTVDLDGKDGNLEQRAIRAWHYCRRVADGVEIHVSSSGEGLHLLAYHRQPVPFHKKIEHRRAAGDDDRRIDMEIQRWHAGLEVDVVFQQKDSPEGIETVTKERRYADVYDALDAVRANRSDPAERMRRLANDGHKGAPDLARRARRMEP